MKPNLLLPGSFDKQEKETIYGIKKTKKATQFNHLKQSFQVKQQTKVQNQRGREYSRPTMRIATKDSVVLIVGPQTKEIVIPKLKLDELKNSYLITPRHQRFPVRRSVLQDTDKVYQYIQKYGCGNDEEEQEEDSQSDNNDEGIWSTRVLVSDRTQCDKSKLQYDLLIAMITRQLANMCLSIVSANCKLIHCNI